jgi:hypothetical protein
MTSKSHTDRITAEIEADIADLPTAEEILAQMETAGNAPEGLNKWEQDEHAESMAIIEQYGRFSATGFHPTLIATVEGLADAYSQETGKRPSIARGKVQRDFKDTVEDEDYFIARQSFHMGHEAEVSKIDDVAAPQLIAIHAPEGSGALSRGNQAIGLLFWPATYETARGDFMPSYYNVGGYAGIVCEWYTADDATAALAELSKAVRRMRRFSLDAARSSINERDTETTDARPRARRKLSF